MYHVIKPKINWLIFQSFKCFFERVRLLSELAGCLQQQSGRDLLAQCFRGDQGCKSVILAAHKGVDLEELEKRLFVDKDE
jgi:hypothetical protein